MTESWLTAGTYQVVVGSAVLVIQRGGMPHDLPVQAGFFKQLTQRSVCWCLILFDATARQYRVTEPVFDSMDDQKLAIDKTDAGGTLFAVIARESVKPPEVV